MKKALTKRIERIMESATSVADLQAALHALDPKMKAAQREKIILEWQYRQGVIRRPRQAGLRVTRGGLPSLGKRTR
jgi:hypothetical protein